MITGVSWHADACVHRDALVLAADIDLEPGASVAKLSDLKQR